MKRRSFIHSITCLMLCHKNLVFAHSKESISIFRSMSELRKYTPQYAGEKIRLSSYYEHTNIGGGVFVAIEDSKLTDDNGINIRQNNNFIWKRITGNNSIIKPEWFGCIGDGLSDDADPFNKMLLFLDVGSVIFLKKNAIYYNAIKDRNSEWIIKKDNITIIGNNASLIRRPTIFFEKDDNLATLKISGNNFKVIGGLNISGNEKSTYLVDKNNNRISSNFYTRAVTSSHGLFIQNVKDIYIEDVVCEDAVFPCFVSGCKDIYISGCFNNSGQVHPVKGDDLQLGSGLKISNSENFILDITSENSAYCGCEIEPNCKNGKVKVISKSPYMHGCILHKNIESVILDISTTEAIKGSGLRISSGCQNISGHVYADTCQYAVLIISNKKETCGKINFKIFYNKIFKRVIAIYNTEKGSTSLEDGLFKIEGHDVNRIKNNNYVIDRDSIVSFYLEGIKNTSFIINDKNKILVEIKKTENVSINLVPGMNGEKINFIGDDNYHLVIPLKDYIVPN
ncbi:hypothetical protein HP572_04340 [Pectobacterium sp. PL64]|uniref:hypothetical protein n=1 Tax=Pectobacterium sp. PL64 TaxID=2738983 RepID=UPI001F0BC5E7|nr:hypothetical protein [Pectobacterium sp. PL64]UMO88806.1 hypothetical protein HP572_04340 [Pectobacterium sp. PL64]